MRNKEKISKNICITHSQGLKDQGVARGRKTGGGGSGKKKKDQWRVESAWGYSAKGWLTFQICPIVHIKSISVHCECRGARFPRKPRKVRRRRESSKIEIDRDLRKKKKTSEDVVGA